MKKLGGRTTSEDYNRIFFEKSRDEVDERRWKLLMSKWGGGKLIDLGCLDSLIPVLALEKYDESEAWGLDYANEAIQEMRERYPQVNYRIGDVYETGFIDGYFDYVVAGELIEHLEDPQRFLKEAFRILRKGGIFALSTPLDEAREPGAVDGDHHVWSFEETDITEMLSPHGIVETKILRTKDFPGERYVFPMILAFCAKT